MAITGLYAGLAALFLIFLSVRVIGQRRSGKVSVGTGNNADLERAMRVQANFTEYTPLLLILLGIAELGQLAGPVLHGFGVAIITGRVFHFIGFASPQAPGRFRVLGMMLTFATLAGLAVVTLGQFAGLF
ncbi:MAG: MAPEG family protein [Pseudomonadota bacterium]